MVNLKNVEKIALITMGLFALFLGSYIFLKEFLIFVIICSIFFTFILLMSITYIIEWLIEDQNWNIILAVIFPLTIALSVVIIVGIIFNGAI